ALRSLPGRGDRGAQRGARAGVARRAARGWLARGPTSVALAPSRAWTHPRAARRARAAPPPLGHRRRGGVRRAARARHPDGAPAPARARLAALAGEDRAGARRALPPAARVERARPARRREPEPARARLPPAPRLLGRRLRAPAARRARARAGRAHAPRARRD